VSVWSYIQQLVGNGRAATVGIFIFILLLAFMFWHKADAAEVDISGGSSFGSEGYGPVLGLGYRQSIQPGLNFTAGTDLWGSTTYNGYKVPNNWDWHGTLEACKGPLCAGVGPAYVQRVDAINGARTNFYLGLRLALSARLSLTLGHVSDAGTSSPNVGRQALTVTYRLQ
jgi:Lipid A 3-O-deacylase (PagL)